jgi:hypothetical protein
VSRRLALSSIGLLAFWLSACAKSEDVIVHTAAGKEKTAAQIDADPLALMPGGAITMMSSWQTTLRELSLQKLMMEARAAFGWWASL